MIRFGNLTIEGYCSIGYFETNLTTNRVTIIRGRNGSGKSSFLSALFWVLYGKPLKEDVKNVNTWKKFQTKEYQGTMVSQYFEKSGHIHQVIRCSNYKGDVRGSKGKNRLVYIIDNVEIEEKRKNEIQDKIIQDLGLSPNLFLSSVMFGQGLKRLVQVSSTDKKDLFEEIFNLSYISEARDMAKKEYDKLLQKHSVFLKELVTSENLLIEYKKLNLEAKNSLENFQKNHGEEVKKLRDKAQQARMEMEKSINGIDYVSRLAKASNAKGDIRERLDDLSKQYRLKLSSVDLSKPEVLSHFIDDLIRLIDKKPSEAKSRLLKMKDSLNYINGYHKNVAKIREEMDRVSEKMDKVKQAISRNEGLTDKWKYLVDSLGSLKKNKPPQVKEYTIQIKEYQAKVDLVKKSIAGIKPLIDNYKWVVDGPLGNKGIKSYIFESSLDELNIYMREYASILGFQVEFSIDLESARKDFYTLIELEGNIVDYKELSGGQQQLVHLAMAFATHIMSTQSLGINILFLDEIFENLDSENVDIVVSLIRKVAKDKSIYVISHKDSLPISNANIITLAREKGLTIFG